MTNQKMLQARERTSGAIENLAEKKLTLERVRIDPAAAPEQVQRAAMEYRQAEAQVSQMVDAEVVVATEMILTSGATA